MITKYVNRAEHEVLIECDISIYQDNKYQLINITMQNQ